MCVLNVVLKKISRIFIVLFIGVILSACNTKWPFSTSTTEKMQNNSRIQTAIEERQILESENNNKKETLILETNNTENIEKKDNVASVPDRIALLLPLYGEMLSFGRAIQAGFEDARQDALQQYLNTEEHFQTENDTFSSTDKDVSNQDKWLKIYDTSSESLPQIVARARQDGATMIVGPFKKNEVEELSEMSIALPTLALNRLSSVHPRPNLCYFALAPEDEARDVARRMHRANVNSPLLLKPDSDLGDRVARAFTQEWKKISGGAVFEQSFGSLSALKKRMKGGQKLSLNGRAALIKNSNEINNDLTSGSEDNKSKNFDAVYFIATQTELRFLKPLLKLGETEPENLNFYASSRGLQTGNDEDFYREMDGVTFNDIPLIVNGEPAIRDKAKSLFGKDYTLIRLYGMGRDAWSLAQHFSELKNSPHFEWKGNTGYLNVAPGCIIARSLDWAKYHQGEIISLP